MCTFRQKNTPWVDIMYFVLLLFNLNVALLKITFVYFLESYFSINNFLYFPSVTTCSFQQAELLDTGLPSFRPKDFAVVTPPSCSPWTDTRASVFTDGRAARPHAPCQDGNSPWWALCATADKGQVAMPSPMRGRSPCHCGQGLGHCAASDEG
jgi:hypothetical protein